MAARPVAKAVIVPAIRQFADSLSTSASKTAQQMAPGPTASVRNTTRKIMSSDPVRKAGDFLEAEGKELPKTRTGAILGAMLAGYGAYTAIRKAMGLK
ncbi:hypothetical protein Ddc_11801 [Ditylenchus destructor]|nr:hypothetical protein Ddc_11801 [Ditylenchus destructor]